MPAIRRWQWLQTLALAGLAHLPATAQSVPFKVLQPLADKPTRMMDPLLHREVYYVPTMIDYVRWGRLPDATAKPAITVSSGSLVTFDVVSHEGVLEDQGRDPVRFFGAHGIRRDHVLDDAITVAASNIPHDFSRDGPHVVSAPVAVEGARPGDILKVDVVALTPRVPYGVTSIRHGKGALPEVFPETSPAAANADAQHPELYHNVSIVIPIREERGSWVGLLRTANGRELHIPLRPMLGIMGVALDTTATLSSIPPGRYGGNMDLHELTVGSTLYLPIEVSGAQFFVSDSHFAQGDGEVDLTGIEGSLRATLRLTVIPAGTRTAPFGGHLTGPFAETPDYWIPMGLDPDLNVAMKNAVRQGVDFLVDRFGMTPTEAYAYESVSVDFHVTQVVDRTKGVHGLIRKREFVQSARSAVIGSTRAARRAGK
jgi:acetamidase/formamidase